MLLSKDSPTKEPIPPTIIVHLVGGRYLAVIDSLRKKRFNMKKIPLLLIGLVLLMQSCIPSLHPLYTPDTLVFEPALLGAWDNDNDDFIFTKLGEKAYLMETKEEGEAKVERYKVHLVKLGEHYFLDFYAYAGNDLLSDDDYGVAAKVRTHTFAKVKWENNQLEIRHFAENEWLEQLFEQRRIRIKHEVLEDGAIILTAGPRELQKFFLKYADDPNVFTESLVWDRVL